MVDKPRIIETVEMHAFARVLKAALGMIVAYWNKTHNYPDAHPYRLAIRMIVAYLENTYHV